MIHLQEDNDSLINPLVTSFYPNSFCDTVCGGEISFLNTTLSPPFEDRPLVPRTLDWFFIISLTFLLLLVFIKLMFNKPFAELVKGSSKSYAYNNDASRTHFPLFFPVVCTCIVFSIAFYAFSRLCEKENTVIFLWTFIISAVFFLIRFFLLRFVGLLFDIKNIISEWKYLTVVLNFTSSIICFPLIFTAYYYSSSLLLGLVSAVFAAVFLFGFARGWTIFRKKIRIYEYFLYFCTVEVLPLLLLFKFVINQLSSFYTTA